MISRTSINLLKKLIVPNNYNNICKSFLNNNNIKLSCSVLESNTKSYNTGIRLYTSTGGKSNIFANISSSNTSGQTNTAQLYRSTSGQVLLDGIRGDGTSLRWFKDVGIAQEGKDFYPLLDGRKLQTPGGNILAVPSKELAIAIASEWDNIDKYIFLKRLPLTQTVITCVDIKPEGREKLIEEFMNHLNTDPVCNRDTGNAELLSRQKKYYDPLLEFGSNYYGIPFFISYGLELSDHPPKLIKAIENHLRSMNNWELVCLQLIASSCKSFLMSVNIYYGNIRFDQLYTTIAIEEEFQADSWGRIPFGHDLAECETHNEIAPPLFVLRNIKPLPLPKKSN